VVLGRQFREGCIQRDVAKDIIDIKSYPITVRRSSSILSGKLIHTGKRIILKVFQYIYERLSISLLWKRRNNQPIIV
jgi:hypothetical protein